MKINQVGVIGAGQMGNGIAHVFALAGYQVLLHDSSFEAAFTGFQSIEKNMNILIDLES